MAPVSTKLKITPPVNVTMKECEYFDVTLVIHYGIKVCQCITVFDLLFSD